MTKEKLKAIEIVEKYDKILPFRYSTNYALNCAREEVKACIRSNPHSNPFNTNPIYSTMEYYKAILAELNKM